MDSSTFRCIAKSVIDEVADYDDSIESRQVVSTVKPGYLRELLPTSAPMDPESFEDIRADVQKVIMPGITHWGSPRFMAFFPCGTSYPASIAEIYSNAFTGAYFNWICSPAVTELETIVLDWVAKALGLPDCFHSTGPTHGGGVIHGSASEAIILTMTAARENYLEARLAHMPDGELKEEEKWRLRSRLVALGSSCVHSSTRKAAKIVGVRFVAVEASPHHGYALRGDDLAAVLAELEGRGLEPFYLTATFGTTDVCATDDFVGIAKVLYNRKSVKSEIWVHVDAAYAGSALILDAYRHKALLFRSFNSFNFGPHKWMLTTFDCSVTYVRNRNSFVDALSIQPPYLKNDFSDKALVTDYRDWQISLGRRFRSLKLWFVLRSYGIRGLQQHIQSGIFLAESLERKLLTKRELFTVFTPAKFALLSLQVRGEDGETVNGRTQRLYNSMNEKGDFYLTSTTVDGKFAIRVCTGVAGIKEEHIERLFDCLVTEAEMMLHESNLHELGSVPSLVEPHNQRVIPLWEVHNDTCTAPMHREECV